MTHDFKIGDRCFVFGGSCSEGDETNAEIVFLRHDLVKARLDNGSEEYWYPSKIPQYIFHQKPVITPPPRPKRKVTKVGWVNLWRTPDGKLQTGSLHPTAVAAEEAKEMMCGSSLYVTTAKLVYEVEE
jgi:hypothetical protein